MIMQDERHRRLNRQDYKTLTLSALGRALEFYDFIIFVFFAGVMGQLFFPADMPEGCARCKPSVFLPQAIWRGRWGDRNGALRR